MLAAAVGASGEVFSDGGGFSWVVAFEISVDIRLK